MNSNTMSGYTWYTVSGINGGKPIVLPTNSAGASRYTVTIGGTAAYDSSNASFTLTRSDSYGTIYYTQDGTNPKTSSTRQTATSGAPITLGGTGTVKAVTYYNGTYGIVSGMTFTYSGMVTIGGSEKYAPEDNQIKLTCSDAGGLCWYTLDGTDPCTSSTRQAYTAGATVELDKTNTQTLKAVQSYNGVYGTVASKTFTPIATSGSAGQNVSWAYANGILTVSGTGAMTELKSTDTQPWADLAPYVNRVVIESGVTTVGSYAFKNFTAMTSVSIADTVASLGAGAFYGCASLKSVSIPESVTSIGYQTFYGCASFTSLVIPDSVTSIGGGAIGACPGLTSLTIPFIGGSLSQTTGTGALFGCIFGSCPSSVEGMKSVMQFYAGSANPYTPNTFKYTNYMLPEGLTRVVVTGGEVNDYAFFGCSMLTDITLPSAATYIGAHALEDTSIITIKIPDTVTEIRYEGFASISSLKSITIPASVTTIGGYAFYQDEGLETVDIKVGATSIGEYAFERCTSLTSISIPETMKSIGKQAFYLADAVTTVNYVTANYNGHERGWAFISFGDANANPMQSGKAYFYLNGDQLDYFSVTGGASYGSAEYAQSVSDYAFYRCQNNMTVVANGGYSGNIGKYAFYKSNICDADFPSSTGSIGDYAFYDCTKLTKYYCLMEGATTIGEGAFYNTGVSTYNLASNTKLTTIGNYAFQDCANVTSLTVPETVTTIGYSAFSGCTGLMKITFLGRNASIGSSAFSDVTANVTYPCGAACAKSSYGGTLTWNVDPASHVFTNYVSDGNATCLADGTKTAACDYSCGTKDTLTDTGSVLGHDYQITEQTNTCTADGTITYTCSRCSDSYTENAAKLGHDYVRTVIPATCTEDGYTEYKCSRCGESYQEDYVDATDHSWSSTVIEPTCTEQGYTRRVCENCGAESIRNYKDPLGHTVPAYTSDGIGSAANTHSGNCSNCGQTITEACSFEDTVVMPTCTKAGYTVHTCSVCGYNYTSDRVAKTGHSLTHVSTAEPTCTEAGNTEYWVCENCGLMFDDDTAEYELSAADVTVAAKGHTEETIPAVAPTCTQSGLTEGTCCSVCGIMLTAQETVPALGHSYESTVTPATCTEGGYTTYTCSVCGESYTADETEALGHSPKDIAGQNPTCTETGLTAGTVCERCGEVLQAQAEVPMIPHTPGEPVEENRVEPTEQQTGSYDSVIYCSVCGAEISRETAEIPELTHSYYIDSVTDPTCTEQGYTTYACANCGDSYNDDYIDALGHEPETIPGYEATDDTDGLTDGVRCSRCGETLTAQTAIPALGHNYAVTSENAATCTQAGSRVWTCETCGNSYTEEIPALGHAYESVTVDATCTENGAVTYTCSRCGDGYSESIPALGHNIVTDEAIPAGEHVDGISEGTHCDRCGLVLVAQVSVPATCHTKDQLEKTEVAPTCTDAGSITYSCSVCDYTVTEPGEAALGHAYVAEVTPATCNEDGYTTYTCSRCGDSYTADETAALGHSEVTDEAVAPTCTEAGRTEGSHCSVCGEVLKAQEEIPTTGHSWGEWTTDESGNTWIRTCISCGKTDQILMGDVNEDGTVNLVDLLLLKRAVANSMADSLNKVGADLNGDGVVDLQDLAALKTKLAG